MDTCRSRTVSVLTFSITLFAAALLAGCGLSADPPAEFGHINLGTQPGQFERDFNAHSDQVRLVFIVGPT